MTRKEASQQKKPSRNKILTIIFVALLIDILAFTIILPLLPRLLTEYERNRENDWLFSIIQDGIHWFKSALGIEGQRMDIVLFGGLIGSLFSFLQYISSPIIGEWSDRYGRKKVLLWSMVGNFVSMLLWAFSKDFTLFALSRVVGGLTEGNVQMSIAMITDITDHKSRSRGMVLVGIAFAIGFTLGPSLGAYFSQLQAMNLLPEIIYRNLPFHGYSGPAIFAMFLILIETIYMIFYLPETKAFHTNDQEENVSFIKKIKNEDNDVSDGSNIMKRREKTMKKTETTSTNRLNDRIKTHSIETDKKYIGRLRWLLFLFLFVFSGMEFTLTFLTHDRFDYSSRQQGLLLGYMGLMSALIQGGYVRRVSHHQSDSRLQKQGLWACFIGLLLLSVSYSTVILYASATFLAFTSATVVNSINSEASKLANSNQQERTTATKKSEQSYKKEDTGAIMGQVRASGQLGRCMGPFFACCGYWLMGSSGCYLLGSTCIAILMLVRFS